MNKMLTLDTGGYVSDPPLVVDLIMNNFFVANYTQTVVHWGKIHSLPYILSKFTDDFYNLAQNIESSLMTMLEAQFESAVVECTIEEVREDEGVYDIRLVATVVKDGVTLDVGKLLSVVKNRISKIENF